MMNESAMDENSGAAGWGATVYCRSVETVAVIIGKFYGAID